MNFHLRILLLAIACVSLTGCAGLAFPDLYKYDLRLASAEREPISQSGIAEATSTVGPSPVGSYSDSLIAIQWGYTGKRLAFELENISDRTIRLIWDEVSWVAPSGEVERIMHEGVRYTERDASQPSTTIPRGGRISDFVLPTSNASYSSRFGWLERGLFVPATTGEGDMNIAQQLVGGIARVFLPVEVANRRYEYTFEFVIDSVAAIPNR